MTTNFKNMPKELKFSKEEKFFLKRFLKEQERMNSFKLKHGVKAKSKHSIKLIPLSNFEKEMLSLKISAFLKLFKTL